MACCAVFALTGLTTSGGDDNHGLSSDTPPGNYLAPGDLAGSSGDSGAQRLLPRVAGAVSSGAAVSRDAGSTQSSAVAAPEIHRCPDARRGLTWYRSKIALWRHKMESGGEAEIRQATELQRRDSRGGTRPEATDTSARSCNWTRRAAKLVRARAVQARHAYEQWWLDNYAWPTWLPPVWVAIARCETHLNWKHDSGSYQGAFGFAVSSWDAFRLPGYPSEAYDATPREQFNVALAIYRRFGFSGWGCA